MKIAAQLGMPPPKALGVAVHRLRRCYGEPLRDAIPRTLVKPDEIDAELRYLFAVISS